MPIDFVSLLLMAAKEESVGAEGLSLSLLRFVLFSSLSSLSKSFFLTFVQLVGGLDGMVLLSNRKEGGQYLALSFCIAFTGVLDD